MNTKFSFALFLVVIVLLLTACAPAITGKAVPIDPVQPAANETVAQVPVTGESAAEAVRSESEPRLWSGEIFQSDNNNPDTELNVQPGAQQNLQNGCMSEDSQPRPYGGCVE